MLPLRICKARHGPGMSGGATLTTGRSTRRETLLLVVDMRGAVVMASALFLRIFLLALRKFGFVACHGANKLPRGVFGTSQRVLICFFMGGVLPPSSICLTITYFARTIPLCTSWCSLPWKRNAISKAGVHCVCPSPQSSLATGPRFVRLGDVTA